MHRGCFGNPDEHCEPQHRSLQSHLAWKMHQEITGQGSGGDRDTSLLRMIKLKKVLWAYKSLSRNCIKIVQLSAHDIIFN